MMKKIIFSALFLCLFAAPGFALPEPQAEVEKMVNSVLEVLQNKELTLQQRKAQVSGRVQGYLNMESMARRTLGPYWDGATEEQRQRFSDLFVKVLEGTYLNKIEDYSGGGVVKYLQQRVKDDKAIIDTVIVAEEMEIPVQYKMIYEGNSWQVFDVVIEGVSLIRNYRESYGEIIRRDGYDGLFVLMEDKVNAMQGGQTVQ